MKHLGVLQALINALSLMRTRGVLKASIQADRSAYTQRKGTDRQEAAVLFEELHSWLQKQRSR